MHLQPTTFNRFSPADTITDRASSFDRINQPFSIGEMKHSGAYAALPRNRNPDR